MTDEPQPIRTRERLYDKTLAEVKEVTEAKLGKPNEHEIEGHAPGALRAKAVTVDGGPQRWRIFYEWEPAETTAMQHEAIP